MVSENVLKVKDFLTKAFYYKQKEPLKLSGISPSFLAYFFSVWLKKILPKEKYDKLVFWVIFPEREEAKEFVEALKLFNEKISEKKADTLLYPPFSSLPWLDAYVFDESTPKRLGYLWNLPEKKFIVGDALSFLRKFPERSLLRKIYLYLLPFEELDRENFLKNLVLMGYERTKVVRNLGEFAVKGGVVDLWSPNYQFPLRIEFWGDEIATLKFFDPETQKSIKTLEEASVIPCKELFFVSEEDKKKFYEKILKHKELFSEKSLSQILESPESLNPLEEERLLPLVYENLSSMDKEILEGFKEKNPLLCLFDEERIFEKIESFEEKMKKAIQKKNEETQEKRYLKLKELFLTREDLEKAFSKFSCILITPLGIRQKDYVFFDVKSPFLGVDERDNKGDSKKDRIEEGFSFLKNSLLSGERVFCAFYSSLDREIILEGLKKRGVESLENLILKNSYLKKGFFYEEESIRVFSEFELFGKSPSSQDMQDKKASLKKRVSAGFRNFEELKPGDFVVHSYYGIGKYCGLVMKELGGIKEEFVEIEYAGGDKLFLPVTKLDELYLYVGTTDKPPKLDSLTRKNFLKRKEKIEKAISEIVHELLTLYAERRVMKSYAIPFSPVMYEKFRATFPYEETPDQAEAIQDVIQDLTSDKPMERLIVGDVGFGKTEVALRASFLTALSGKQVAFLVPTTILAEQHYQTFKQRLEPFGIKVGVLSRLRPQREIKETLRQIKTGEIKVVIGTHKLLSSSLSFHDLGLVIIDEEHKFGVKQKEKLKKIKKDVKVLILSATPIPRSLQMSLLGLYDLSLIETPPPGRKEIKTILARFRPEIIKEAIYRELERGGQVFFVNPRIQGISALANYVKRLVPEAKVEIIHGKMPPEEIEKNLYQFLNKEVDVLVCTPIIGSGIDIPSANTIIINRAEMFGLADIYQLRGRVGRSDEEAYAYLLVPSFKGLTEDAQKRLKALMRFVKLGSGFKLALSDLKIRGAGELLGVHQSGHINSVGYELYLDILQKTIEALKGKSVKSWEPQVEIKVPAYIPSTYVPDVEEKLSIYKNLVLIENLSELEDFKTEIADRYGPLPEEVENLFRVYELKILMKEKGIPLIEKRGEELRFWIKSEEKLPLFRKIKEKLRINFRVERREELFCVAFICKEENLLPLALRIIQEI